MKIWQKNNPDKIREWKINNPDKIKKMRDRNRYNGMATRVLKRDNHECQICGSKDKLNIHHFNKDRKDNRYWNLLTLCASCHKMAHNGFL